jgi:anti-sigma-K factor RskA
MSEQDRAADYVMGMLSAEERARIETRRSGRSILVRGPRAAARKGAFT